MEDLTDQKPFGIAGIGGTEGVTHLAVYKTPYTHKGIQVLLPVALGSFPRLIVGLPWLMEMGMYYMVRQKIFVLDTIGQAFKVTMEEPAPDGGEFPASPASQPAVLAAYHSLPAPNMVNELRILGHRAFATFNDFATYNPRPFYLRLPASSTPGIIPPIVPPSPAPSTN